MARRKVYGLFALVFLLAAIVGIAVHWARRKQPVIVAQPTPEAPSVLQEGKIDVSRPWTDIAHIKGHFAIEVSGTATLNPAEGPVGPEGNGIPAPASFALPNASGFCALVKINNQVEKLGSRKEFNLSKVAEIYLGPNDELQPMNGHAFADNSGAWTYRVLLLK
jgi:hypothetical protein